MLNEQLKKMVDSDLERLELYDNIYQHELTGVPLRDGILESIDMDEFMRDMLDIIAGLNSRYSIFMKDFPEDVDFKKLEDDSNGDADVAIVYFYTYIKRVIEKLKSFKMNGYKDDSGGIMTNNINISNDVKATSTSNSNSFSNAVSILSFEDAKKNIEEMSALNDTEIDEILKRIDELEQIVNTSERKSKKWESIKGIIKWVADKSFDVAKIIIPLAFKIEDQ